MLPVALFSGVCELIWLARPVHLLHHRSVWFGPEASCSVKDGTSVKEWWISLWQWMYEPLNKKLKKSETISLPLFSKQGQKRGRWFTEHRLWSFLTDRLMLSSSLGDAQPRVSCALYQWEVDWSEPYISLGVMATSFPPGTCFALLFFSGLSTHVGCMLCNLSVFWESCLPGENYLPYGLPKISPLDSGLFCVLIFISYGILNGTRPLGILSSLHFLLSIFVPTLRLIPSSGKDFFPHLFSLPDGGWPSPWIFFWSFFIALGCHSTARAVLSPGLTASAAHQVSLFSHLKDAANS